uniref:Uncharacterized protein n=1 Tax=Anopheles albimanus TaxID=7167 RepID=A0A182F5U8_ANOAL
MSMYSECYCPIGASIVAMCPKNVGLHTNPALAMCKPTFEIRPPTITPAMLVPRDTGYRPAMLTMTTTTSNVTLSGTATITTTPATGGITITPTGNPNTTSNNNSTTVANNNSKTMVSNSKSTHSIVKSTSGQLGTSGVGVMVKSNGTAKEQQQKDEKSFL